MGYPTPDYRAVRDQILRDINNLQPDEYVGKDSDAYVRATANGNAVEGLYEHQKWIVRQIFPDTSDFDILISKHARPRGIEPKAASFATGTIRLPGAEGSIIAIGTEGKLANGVAYVTTASGTVGVGGTVDVAARAVVAGSAGNQVPGTVLTLTAPPSGVQSKASIVSMTGGTEAETAEELLARVLFDIRMPPMGGAKHDYYRWAMAVPGVKDAYVFERRRTPNSVDVVIETAGGVPSPTLLAEVLAYIETQRPACTDLVVMAPTLITVDVTGALSLVDITLAEAVAKVTPILQKYFATLEVGDVVRKVKIESLITSVKGVVDVNLAAPSGNVLILADATHSELAVLGAVNLT